MTREEAIAEIERLLECAKKLEGPQTFVEFRPAPALEMALTALRPITREQVEKVWKGDWKFEPDIYDCGTYVCSKCGEPWTLIDGTPVENNMNFCPVCGAAQTDEAVDMVMERLEALKDGKND